MRGGGVGRIRVHHLCDGSPSQRSRLFLVRLASTRGSSFCAAGGARMEQGAHVFPLACPEARFPGEAIPSIIFCILRLDAADAQCRYFLRGRGSAAHLTRATPWLEMQHNPATVIT